MVVKVNPKVLRKVFDDTIKGKKVMMNFWCNGNELVIEVLKDYTIIKSIKCESLDMDHKAVDCSFYATKALQCISDEEPITLTFMDAALLLSQSFCNCTLIREYEARREYSADGIELKEAYSRRLKYLCMTASSMSKIAKEIKVPDTDPVIYGDKFYVKYWNTVFMDGMKYPESCLSMSSLRDFVFLLDDDTKYGFITEKGMYYFKTGSYDIWVPTISYNIKSSEIVAIDKEYARCRPITEVCIMNNVDKFTTLAGAFPNQQIYFTIGKGLTQASVQSNAASFVVGDRINNYLISMCITPGQLEFICKLFGQDNKITIKKGGNCLCLEQKEKILMVSGVAY